MTGAVGRARGAFEAENWQHAEELLAVVAELVQENTRAIIIANSRKGAPKPKEFRVPRPYDNKPKANRPKRAATSEDLAVMFGGKVKHVPTGSLGEGPQ